MTFLQKDNTGPEAGYLIGHGIGVRLFLELGKLNRLVQICKPQRTIFNLIAHDSFDAIITYNTADWVE